VVTLGTIKDATGHEAVTRYLEEHVLPGSDWNLVKVRRKTVRLEPPFAYWATYAVKLGRGELVYPEPDAAPVLESGAGASPDGLGTTPAEVATAVAEAELPEPSWSEERELRLVARGIFDSDQWTTYRDRVATQYRDQADQPLEGRSRPQIFDDTQHCIWFFPTDPNMTSLGRAADPLEMRRIFRNHKGDLLDYPGRLT